MQLIINEVIAGNNPATVNSRSQQLCAWYSKMEPSGKYDFLQFISQNYSVDIDNAKAAAQSFITAQERGEASIARAQEKLQVELIPPYGKIFSQIGKLQGGVKFLVDLRTDLLNLISMADRKDSTNLYQLRTLNNHIQELLSLWFSVGFLQLERITWLSSCDIIQKISEYEAVHPVRNWPDVKRRVGPYRRCYVFTHHSMPGEPLVVLHTALTSDISSSIAAIVKHQDDNPVVPSVQEDPNLIRAAIFYSISSTQKGLSGIDLGNQLIKRVVTEVQLEFPQLRQFSTLSPITGFRDWLVGEFNRAERGETTENSVLTWDEITQLVNYLNLKENENGTIYRYLVNSMKTNHWAQDKQLVELLRKPLLRICARYLYQEKRRGYALNSVANFHLRNGAVLWRLNWMADSGPRGLTSACGIMVNYRYFLEALEENTRRYIEEQHINASDRVLAILSPGSLQSAL